MKKMNVKAKTSILAGVALIVAALLIISGVFVYYEYFEEEKPTEEEPVKVIDDRISPLENQGLILEVLRIRNRGLYEKLLTPGNSYKIKPSFYFVTELDGLEYKSKDVSAFGGGPEILLNTWDSMFMENKISRDAEEEQETSTVTLSIFERTQVKTGLFRKTTKDIEKEKIRVVYDYRTGRWSGDDNFKDYDGYGHYAGKTYEFWFNIYQNDFDRDYIPYWTEVNVLGTDPRRDDSNKDPDGDGIPTFWEWRWGCDPFTWDDHEKLDTDIDGLENIEEYQNARWLADPYHQDIYIEVDHMGEGPRTSLLIKDKPHIFWEESAQAIMEKYSEHNINMYFDMGWPDTPRNGGGNVLPHYAAISQDSGMILQFYNHYFPDERKGSWRYVVMGHGFVFNHPSKGNVYDSLHIGYAFSIKNYIMRFILYGIPPTQRGTIKSVASSMMHELGHSVGIHPWNFEGCDNMSFLEDEKTYDETWGKNYWSTMNYYNIYNMKLLDYSDGSNGPPYDQNDWLKLFIPTFEYNSELVEEIYFEPPGYDKIVYGETEVGVTGYTYDENLTKQFEKTIKDWSPVHPIKANWLVFKLTDKDKYPNYREIKILVQPKEVPGAGWAEYAEGKLNSEGKIQFYSQQEIIDDIMEQLEK